MAKVKTEKELRKVSLVALVFFGIMSGLLYWKGSYKATIFFSTLFLFLGVIPTLFKKPGYAILKRWLVFTGIIGEVINRILLALVYFIVISPMGLMMKLGKRDRLAIRKNPEVKTYWKNLELNSQDEVALKQSYSRQF